MSDTHENIVYGLIDPRTLLIHYIGQSSWGLEYPRMHRHESIPETRCRRWVKELESRGFNYDVVVLETGNDAADLAAMKLWWMNYGRASGWPLTNSFKHRSPASDVVESRQQRGRRTLCIQVHVTEEQKKTLAATAADAGMTLAGWMLYVALRAARTE